MGLFDFIKTQFIEVIEWTDSSDDTIVYRFPVENREIKMGAQLTVRESQKAIFVNEGKICDIFNPGRYTLSTANLPILTKIKSWKYGFNSPFKAEVYFVNSKQFIDQKWGTSNPVMIRDQEFGMIRIRAYGIYSFRVSDPGKFLNEVFGTSNLYTLSGIEGQIKRSMISGIADMIAESNIQALELAKYYDELSQKAENILQERVNRLGIKIESLYIENISLPEEVEKVLDKRTSMGIIGDMKQYAKYNTAEAIKDAANNEGGSLASTGAAIGAGAAIGKTMAEAFSDSSEYDVCRNCATKVEKGSKYCPNCGNLMNQVVRKCIKCGNEISDSDKFCPACGAEQTELKCKVCNSKLDPGTKFCPECGNKV